MRIIDLSQEVFGCEVYPGDRGPKPIIEQRMSQGAVCNLSSLELCAHNGTHLDAPFHFIENGKTIDELPLEKLIGWCFVTEYSGVMGRETAEQILETAQQLHKEAYRKILLKGRAIVSEEAARVFADRQIDLLGIELQSVGPEEAPMYVHRILLGAEVCLLEGLRLQEAEEGVYFLHAAPLSLGGFDGAPCRATLIEV